MCKGQVPSKRPPSGVEMRIERCKVLEAGERDADADVFYGFCSVEAGA